MKVEPRRVDGEIVTCMVCGANANIVPKITELPPDEEFAYFDVKIICHECKGTFMHWKGMDNIEFSETLKFSVKELMEEVTEEINEENKNEQIKSSR